MNDIFRQAGQTLTTLTRQVEQIRQVVESGQSQLLALERQGDSLNRRFADILFRS